MEERTRAYLRGRFRDHYRTVEPELPPAADEREWGYIPWTSGTGTTMVRHNSLLDLGTLRGFLERERPRHVYFSAGRYRNPGAGTMDVKGWQSADLVFDLDADHLPGVTPETPYAEMLARGKAELLDLLDLLDRDFGFDDMTVVFSGGRGYHVHVRDEGVLELDREARREIVDYVRAANAEFESLIQSEAVAGIGLKNPTQKRTLPTDSGWGGRVHDYLCSFVDELLAMEEEDALELLQEFDGIGAGKAAGAYKAAKNNHEEIERGNVDVHPAFYGLAKILAADVFESETAAVDEPVTTDTHRLIRLPGSLHGGSSLEVTRIPHDELVDFDPLRDAVPETFTRHDVTIELDEEVQVELAGERFRLPAGDVSTPEYVANFLMARGRAEKGKE
ncbi:DNA primase small subunit PriS [Haladaptatus pallidirubidus]|uniref:DNA primase small subunit PriS n=1 Tax=Haladaptatus pallidirubidus TaxID=1008152 RepID=A0AAV3UDY3_9EURY|nr:DNA primase small subunit PriS [Haladaptatus pallidirubidus]